MCGIFGILRAKPTNISTSFAEKLSSQMHHRGPNVTGFYGYHIESQKSFLQPSVPYDAEWNVFFLFKRLSIQDLNPRGNQPMQSSDGRYTLIFNGEIYNFRTLRKQLEQKGIVFHTNCDTEVLLQYLIHIGTDHLQELEGMFAFAFWDREKNTCVLARDPFGIKPLYFFHHQGVFAFSSIISCLLELPECRRKIDLQQSINYILRFDRGYGSRTMLQDIHRVPPGHQVTLQIKDHSIDFQDRYYFKWKPTDEKVDDFDFCVKKTRQLLEESIEKHLISDVPVCFNCSGGVDSSALIGIASRSHSNLTAFCYQADDPRIDESGYAECVTRHCKIQLVKVLIPPTDVEKDFDTYLTKQEEPFGSASNYVDYKVFEAQRKAGFTVSLNGQGGDEMFAGYLEFAGNAFKSALSDGQWKRAFSLFVKSSEKKRLGALAIDEFLKKFPTLRLGFRKAVRTKYSLVGFNHKAIAKYLLLPPMVNTLRAALTQALLMTSIPPILSSNDKNAMAFSMENRVPFLWDPLVQFSHMLPESYLISNDGWMKFILRKAIEDIIPKEIAWRKDKIGYAPTEALWLLKNKKFFTHLLESKTFEQIPDIQVEEVRCAWKTICNRNEVDGWKSDIFWRYLCLIRWIELFRMEF